jgi:hypothetical protein
VRIRSASLVALCLLGAACISPSPLDATDLADKLASAGLCTDVITGSGKSSQGSYASCDAVHGAGSINVTAFNPAANADIAFRNICADPFGARHFHADYWLIDAPKQVTAEQVGAVLGGDVQECDG